jgi:hypothetical protein
MRALFTLVVASSLASAAQPVCNSDRATLLFDQGANQKPRLLRCDGQQWSPYELPDAVVTEPLDAGVPQKTPEELAQCKASCATQNAYCLNTQCGPISGAPCKQRCARSLAICATGCTPKAPAPVKASTAVAPAAAPAVAAPATNEPPPLPARAAPAPQQGPSALETFGKALDVVDRGLNVIDGPSQPAPAGSAPSSISASATCCVNHAGYTCPSPAAVDRCSGAFMRCMMSGKDGSTCLKESPPDPSGCRRDPSVVCK